LRSKKSRFKAKPALTAFFKNIFLIFPDVKAGETTGHHYENRTILGWQRRTESILRLPGRTAQNRPKSGPNGVNNAPIGTGIPGNRPPGHDLSPRALDDGSPDAIRPDFDPILQKKRFETLSPEKAEPSKRLGLG
jgi:hypothetical protein